MLKKELLKAIKEERLKNDKYVIDKEVKLANIFEGSTISLQIKPYRFDLGSSKGL